MPPLRQAKRRQCAAVWRQPPDQPRPTSSQETRKLFCSSPEHEYCRWHRPQHCERRAPAFPSVRIASARVLPLIRRLQVPVRYDRCPHPPLVAPPPTANARIGRGGIAGNCARTHSTLPTASLETRSRSTHGLRLQAEVPRMTSTVHSGCQCADLVGHPQKVVVYPTGLMVPNECPKVRRAIERSSAQSVRLQSRVGSRLLPRRVAGEQNRQSAFKGVFFGL